MRDADAGAAMLGYGYGLLCMREPVAVRYQGVAAVAHASLRVGSF